MKEYFAFQWHITDECDQRCKHCYIFAEDNNIPLHTMTWEQMQLVLKNCITTAEQMGKLPYLYITGGDPILHPQFWELLKLLKENEIPFSIMGNPYHLTDKVCKDLKSYGCERYQVSIDGMCETHDMFRKPGSFDITLEKIKYINKSGMKSVVMTTVSKTNMAEIPQIIDTVVAHKVRIFAFARYCPTGSDKSAHMTPTEYRALLDTCWSKFEQYKDCDTTFNLKDHLWTPFLHEKGLYQIPEELAVNGNEIYDGCNCGINHMTILPTGEVYACRRMESNIGNALQSSLYDIFQSEQMNCYRQYNQFEKCSKCELLHFCRGCPAVAYGYTQNHLSCDPQCWKAAEIA